MNLQKRFRQGFAGPLFLAASLNLAQGEADLPVMEDPFDWRLLEAAPLPVDFERAAIGLSDDSIIVSSIGGDSLSPNPIYYLDLSADSPEWRLAVATLPAEISSMVAVSPEDGIFYAGGVQRGEPTDALFRAFFNRDRSSVEVERLPLLPDPLTEIRGERRSRTSPLTSRSPHRDPRGHRQGNPLLARAPRRWKRFPG